MTSRSLLIVDDEPWITDILCDELKDEGITITVTNSSVDALRLASEHVFDAILSDINMPELNGLELLKKLRERSYMGSTVFLTAHGESSMIVAALRLGAFDFISKPWQPDRLMKVVKLALELGFASHSLKGNIAHILSGIANAEGREALRKKLEAVERLKLERALLFKI